MWKRVTLMSLLAATAAAPGQEPGPADRLAPFVDDQTLSVAHCDLTRLDTRPVWDLLALMPPPAGLDRNAVEAELRSVREAGVRELFVIYSAADIPADFCVLIPTDQAGRLAGRQVEGIHTAEVGGFTAFGTERAVARLARLKPVARPGLAEAFAAAGDAPLRLVVTLPLGFRDAFEQISPELPKALGGGPIRRFTRGVDWLALGLSTDEKLTARLTVKAADADTARALDRAIGSAVESAGSQPAPLTPDRTVREAYGDLFDRAAALFRPRVDGDRLTVEVGLLPALRELGADAEAHPRGRLQRTINNLKEIGLAVHNFHDQYGRMPADITDPDGKPLLSWRVAILPLVGEEKLYERFRLNEPWDSEHNRALLAAAPGVFGGEGRTRYLGVAGESGMFPGKPVRFADVTDGMSNTVMVVAVRPDMAVEWTRPADLEPGPMTAPADLLDADDADGLPVLFGDGSVRVLPRSLDPAVLRALFTRDGGEVVELP